MNVNDTRPAAATAYPGDWGASRQESDCGVGGAVSCRQVREGEAALSPQMAVPPWKSAPTLLTKPCAHQPQKMPLVREADMGSSKGDLGWGLAEGLGQAGVVAAEAAGRPGGDGADGRRQRPCTLPVLRRPTKFSI